MRYCQREESGKKEEKKCFVKGEREKGKEGVRGVWQGVRGGVWVVRG